MSQELLNLPAAAQIALASGYAGYMLAFAGHRVHHQTIDIAFNTLVFGLIATAILSALTPFLGLFVAGASAFIGASTAGLIWRRWGHRAFRWVLRKTDVSWSNDDQSALITLMTNSTYPVSQIAVQLDDGGWLECIDTTRFNDAPYGPCLIGKGGDVALYVTHETLSNGERRELSTVSDPYYGTRLTYLPSEKVRRITIRHMHSQFSRPSQEAAEASPLGQSALEEP